MTWSEAMGKVNPCGHTEAQHMYSVELGLLPCTVINEASQPINARADALEQALVRLLVTDGHTTKCNFAGCTCGMVEDYKLARAAAVELIRNSENAEKKQTTS